MEERALGSLSGKNRPYLPRQMFLCTHKTFKIESTYDTETLLHTTLLFWKRRHPHFLNSYKNKVKKTHLYQLKCSLSLQWYVGLCPKPESTRYTPQCYFSPRQRPAGLAQIPDDLIWQCGGAATSSSSHGKRPTLSDYCRRQGRVSRDNAALFPSPTHAVDRFSSYFLLFKDIRVNFPLKECRWKDATYESPRKVLWHVVSPLLETEPHPVMAQQHYSSVLAFVCKEAILRQENSKGNHGASVTISPKGLFGRGERAKLNLCFPHPFFFSC